MASSSSSFNSTPPSSSSQSWKYDVFLSFRGTDTRNTFVDHLYSSFVRQGIDTYKDDKTLPRGETIAPSLLRAIEESRIAVIIFSENYADSSWCLDELAHIMKCKDDRGQIVIPLFYHIDPSEVRKQKGKYGEALAKYESENRNVESWRKALADAGSISGHVANGPETIFIKGIVDTISERLFVALSSDNEDLIGMEARLQDLKSKLAMDSHDVLMVGIWGLGGGGKTTLASALYDEISTNFDGSCFVKDIREESSKHGLPKLQKEIISLVLKQKEEEVVGDVGSLIKSRLRNKKVLMVLDDVDHVDQLKKLAGSNAWFGDGSRIIITTRDNHLLNARKVNVVYNISLLNDDEAMKLFCKHALLPGRRIKDYEMLSEDVVSYAGGLPLALKVLGSFLCDKDTSEWISALARLRGNPDMDIVEKLKISYDGLKPLEKELFLDIACFFVGAKKDEATVILDACGFYPVIGVKVLIQKALIEVSEGTFDMHDLLQEMGHYIVRAKNRKNPEKHCRVWQRKDVLHICAMDVTRENHKIEALRIEWHQDPHPPSLPQVVANMKKLRWISCFDYPATSLPINFQPTKLCCLQLERSLVEQVWEGYKHLPNLKVLDLHNSARLVSTPDVGGLPCLERMILENCTKLKVIHPSIGYHERLTFLNMKGCKRLKMFPPIIRMKKLQTILLSYCTRLCQFPEIKRNMSNLVELSLRESGVEIVPSSIGQYCTNLVSLDLRGCKYLHSIEGNFRLLKHLKGLYLTGCNQLMLPAEGPVDVDCCLEVLSLSTISFKDPVNYRGFEENLHGGMASMKVHGFSRSLRKLSLKFCKLEDGDLSSVLSELSNLQVLDLSYNNFSRLHSSLTQLPRLKYLNLSYCFNLVELPDLPSSIAVLIAHECDSLELVGGLPTNYKWLWKFSFSTRTLSMILNPDNKLIFIMIECQGNALEDYFMSLQYLGTRISTRDFQMGTFTLELPRNWYNDFSGFLICMKNLSSNDHLIVIGDVLDMDYEDDVLQTFDEMSGMCYISFGSLRQTTWWSSPHSTISFFIEGLYLKAELVPRRSKRGSKKRAKDTSNCSEYWDEEARHRKTFEIEYDSKSSIEISWCHRQYWDVFDHF
ncbi:hypothetical protein OSB04_018702 [Centaurea solstitialis]|uniref:TIR domain-containing protein n=1 Tax=Centaurea solstitialis TaxID=347529 RepID=A0AA38WBS9_9ASTR|nr:hypothetical protein OSB04_018702 [Centaurea solstitialis]